MMRMRAIVPAGMVYAVAPTAAVIMGDSLMYVVLPVAAVEFGAGSQYGLSASFWIGLALSINRFVRLASNACAATLYQWFGVRWPFVGSIVLGALTTLAYGLGSGLVVLLAARALWGVAYSCMRLAAHLMAFAVGTSEMRGRLMGFFNSGQRSGSLVAVTAGALLYQLTSKEVTFTVLAGVGLLGVIVAVRVPDLRPERVRPTVKGLLERLKRLGPRRVETPGLWPQAPASSPLHQPDVVRDGVCGERPGNRHGGPVHCRVCGRETESCSAGPSPWLRSPA